MRKFFVSLALVSGLLIVESRADDTGKWCTFPQEAAIPHIAGHIQQGFPAESLDEKQSASYLSAAREIASGVIDIPEIPGVTLIITQFPGLKAQAYFFKNEMHCGRLTLPWPAHERAMKAAKGEPV